MSGCRKHGNEILDYIKCGYYPIVNEMLVSGRMSAAYHILYAV